VKSPPASYSVHVVSARIFLFRSPSHPLCANRIINPTTKEGVNLCATQSPDDDPSLLASGISWPGGHAVFAHDKSSAPLQTTRVRTNVTGNPVGRAPSRSTEGNPAIGILPPDPEALVKDKSLSTYAHNI